ncbi:TPA: hypothetical protein HA278_03635 [Candidatus Woesearchaeota archaeon]|jgi:hypothetical protein|nr:hypothetical protein [archaeon]HIJ11122.1 hypothetical protein [Candidatus Woesearchaeota archaeon]|tara:strand:+ start:101 stop:427 length:327 start_codon:yes stop_codon:yes gene_type:complete
MNDLERQLAHEHIQALDDSGIKKYINRMKFHEREMGAISGICMLSAYSLPWGFWLQEDPSASKVIAGLGIFGVGYVVGRSFEGLRNHCRELQGYAQQQIEIRALNGRR